MFKQLCMLKPRSADEEVATKLNLSSLAYYCSKSKLEKAVCWTFLK